MIDIPKDIPNKQDFPQVKKLDRQIIRAAVLLGLDNQSAFALYHAEYIDGRGKLNDAGKRECSHFWSYGKNREYREAYEKTVDEFFNGGRRKHVETDIDDTRIEGALKKLLNQAIGLLDSGDNLDPDSVKTIVEVFRKMNLLRDEQEQEIKPLRFLPSRCGECRYKAFVESSVLEGQAIDECQYCKALKVAKDNGYRYDPCTNLDIPEDVVKRLEEKNNVSTLDILNGKIEN